MPSPEPDSALRCEPTVRKPQCTTSKPRVRGQLEQPAVTKDVPAERRERSRLPLGLTSSRTTSQSRAVRAMSADRPAMGQDTRASMCGIDSGHGKATMGTGASSCTRIQQCAVISRSFPCSCVDSFMLSSSKVTTRGFPRCKSVGCALVGPEAHEIRTASDEQSAEPLVSMNGGAIVDHGPPLTRWLVAVGRPRRGATFLLSLAGRRDPMTSTYHSSALCCRRRKTWFSESLAGVEGASDVIRAEGAIIRQSSGSKGFSRQEAFHSTLEWASRLFLRQKG